VNGRCWIYDYCKYAIVVIMWSVNEAGRLMNLSGQRVRKLLSEGRIEGKKIGSTWVIFELSYTRRKRPTKKDALYVQVKGKKRCLATKGINPIVKK